jgi:hypothetical protein
MMLAAAPIRAGWAAAALMLALVAFGWYSVARAHQINLTNARITINLDGTVDVVLAMRGSDVDRAIGTKLFDAETSLVRPDALAAAAPAIAAYSTAHAVVLNHAGTLCRPRIDAVSPDGDGVAVHTRWTCGEADKLRYRSTVLIDIAPDARQVVLMSSGGKIAQDLLTAGRTEIALLPGPEPKPAEIIERYTEAGAAYSFIGYSHIAFLVAILLWVRGVRPVAKILGAFTLSHSITLWLATLGVARIPGAVVGPAMAASVIYVAAKNFLSQQVETRWRDTFVLGLIHGFGFAATLRAFGLPANAPVLALASFNIGIEVVQIEIVVIVLVGLLVLDRLLAVRSRSGTPPRLPAFAVYAISAMLVALGGYWFVARTVLQT